MKFKVNKIYISGIFLLLYLIFSSCNKLIPGKPSDLNDVLKRGRLVVLTDSSSLGYALSGDSLFGFQYEIVKAFADSLNVELIISKISDIKSAIESINTGEADLLAFAIPVTTEYASYLQFSEPLFQSTLVLVQSLRNKNENNLIIKNQSELAGEKVSVTKNSQYIKRLINLSDEIADSIYIQEIDNINNDSIIKLVSNGTVKYAVCPAFFSKYYALKNPELDFSLTIGFLQNYSWAVHVNSSSLLNKLNEFLLNFVDSYEYRTIYRKYF